MDNIPVDNTTPTEPQPEENRFRQLLRSPFVIAGTIFIVLIFVIAIILISHSAKAPIQSPGPQTNQHGLSVTTTLPKNGSTKVSLFPVITVSFNRPLNLQEQKAVTITFTPSLKGYSQWVTDSHLTFRPYKKLAPTTAYSFTISGNNLFQTVSFKTKGNAPLTRQEQEESQSISDKKYADYWRNVSQTYPWYDKLPLQTDTYFVFFSISKKTFIADLYPNKTTPPSNTETLKQTVIQELQKIGVPKIATIPILWTVH